jgi:hypothetical protein
VYLYIPRSLIVCFFCAAFGLAAGWLLNSSAQDVATARSATSEAWRDAPRRAVGPPYGTGPVRGTSTSLGAEPGSSASGGAIYGDSSTVSTRTHLERTASGRLIGTSEAITPDYMPPIPTGPGAYPTTPRGRGAPGAAPQAGPSSSYPTPATPPTVAPRPPTGYAPPRRPSSVPGPSSTFPFPTQGPLTVTSAHPTGATSGQALGIEIPPFLPQNLFTPLPGAKSRGVSFSEWESYRTDLAGRNIIATTDDSNVYVNRIGKLNGNTGDTDASGLNVTDATDSVIRGTESADEAPYQTASQAVVDIATANPDDLGDLGDSDSDDDGDANDPDPGANPEDRPVTTPTPKGAESNPPSAPISGKDITGDTDRGDPAAIPAVAGATAVRPAPAPVAPAPASAAPVATAANVETDRSGGSDSTNEGYDFPYVSWTNAINGGAATAVHTDEGTTLASGQDALVVGADGYDDDDNRVAGENVVVTRDDGNVVLGGAGDVNAQIGDSEQGAVIMDVHRVFIQGGGAY